MMKWWKKKNESCEKTEEKDDQSKAENTPKDSVRVKSVPKVGQRVKFLPKDSDEWKTGTIHSRAGKATGKYSSWRNIEHDNGYMSAIDWNRDVEDWIPILEKR